MVRPPPTSRTTIRAAALLASVTSLASLAACANVSGIGDFHLAGGDDDPSDVGSESRTPGEQGSDKATSDDGQTPTSNPTPSESSATDAGPSGSPGADASVPTVDAGPTSGCKTTPPTHGTAAVGSNISGSWNSVASALVADGKSATFTFNLKNIPGIPIVITGFGFSIPPTATIQGVALQVVHMANTHYVKDSAINLVSDDNTLGSNQAASAAEWPQSLATKTYGSDRDGWGAGLTPSIVNDASFGVGINAVVSTTGSLPTYPIASIDEVTIAITYCE